MAVMAHWDVPKPGAWNSIQVSLTCGRVPNTWPSTAYPGSLAGSWIESEAAGIDWLLSGIPVSQVSLTCCATKSAHYLNVYVCID